MYIYIYIYIYLYIFIFTYFLSFHCILNGFIDIYSNLHDFISSLYILFYLLLFYIILFLNYFIILYNITRTDVLDLLSFTLYLLISFEILDDVFVFFLHLFAYLVRFGVCVDHSLSMFIWGTCRMEGAQPRTCLTWIQTR